MRQTKNNFIFVGNYKIDGVPSGKLTDVRDFILNSHTFCLDVETRPKPEWYHHDRAGLDPYLSDIIMLQVGNHEVQYAIDTRDFSKDELWEVLEAIQNSEKKAVGHNIKFDYKMLLSNYGIRLNTIHDTMVQEKILHCGRFHWGYSLEKLVGRYLNFKYAKTNQLSLFETGDSVGILNKDLRKSFKRQGEKPFTYEQILYGCKDVEFCYKIYLIQLRLLMEQNLYFLSSIENRYTIVLAEKEYNGMYISPVLWIEQYERNKERYKELRESIIQYIREKELTQFYDFQLSLFDLNPDDFEGEVDINLSSSRQVIELCKALGIPTKILDKQKTKEKDQDVFKDSVEERHLRKYSKDHELIPLYLEFKKYEKAISTYGRKYLSHVNPVTNRIHSGYEQIMNTGRIASKNPNMQNIPSNNKFPGFRECFQAEEGNLLVVRDYSGQESRVLAEISQDPELVHFFNYGDGDHHSFTAKRMFGDKFISKDESPELRALAKVLNFGEATPK